MTAWLELLWLVQRGGIEMNFVLIMFCLKRHWRATRITEKAFNAPRCGVIFWVFGTINLPAKAVQLQPDKQLRAMHNFGYNLCNDNNRPMLAHWYT